MSTNGLSVAIIGAGMGGLATAAALRRSGVRATVYEQASQFARLGAGIQIGCNAMQVLRGLGLEPRLQGDAFCPRSWNNKDWQTAEEKFGAAAWWRFEATRKERTSRVQLSSRTNTWLRTKTDTDWGYSYNAWTAPSAA